MLSILYKEFAVQRTAILIFAVLAVLDALLLFPLPDPLAFGTILAIFFTFSTASHEDKNNSHILLNSLPVDRKEIITAKYAFHIGIGIAFTGLAGILGALSGSWPPGTGPWQTGVFALVIIWFVSLFFSHVFLVGAPFCTGRHVFPVHHPFRGHAHGVPPRRETRFLGNFGCRAILAGIPPVHIDGIGYGGRFDGIAVRVGPDL